MIAYYTIDDYGVKEYKAKYKILITFIILYLYITIMAYPMWLLEQGVGNIHSYGDAFYLMQITITTIGYGDHYPVTTEGRWLAVVSFYIGMGLAGYISVTVANLFTNFTDHSVQNRELRKQNEKIIQLLEEKK